MHVFEADGELAILFHQRLTLERRAFEFSLSRCHIVFHPPRPSFSPRAFYFFLFTLIILCLRLTLASKSDRFEQPHAMAACLSIDAQCFWRYPLIAWFGIVRAAPFIGFVHRCWFLVFFPCSRYFRNESVQLRVIGGYNESARTFLKATENLQFCSIKGSR